GSQPKPKPPVPPGGQGKTTNVVVKVNPGGLGSGAGGMISGPAVMSNIEPPVIVPDQGNAVVSTPAVAWQTKKYLPVRNNSRETVTVYVVSRETGRKPLAYELEPGEETFLQFGDELLAASQVRLWAESETKVWEKYRDTDLVLVPEAYQAEEMAAYTYTLR